MRTRRTGNALLKWGVFLALCVAIAALLWIAWSVLNHDTSIPGITTVQSDSKAAVGLTKAPQSLDIRTETGHPIEQALLENVYETLIKRDADNQLVPGLASSWDVSDDALTYTLTLHDSLRFSNGDTLDSNDVIWSLQQIIGEQYVGYEQLSNVHEVSNPDAHTVVITLTKPNPQLLRALSGRAGIVYHRDTSIDYATQALGSGPFTVSNYASGSSMTLKRNDSYWAEPSKSSEITLNYYADEATMMEDLKNGKIHMAVPVSADAAKEAEEYPTLTVSEGATTSKKLVAFNSTADTLYSDRRIRQATRMVIDSALIARDDPDAAAVLAGPISPLEPGYEDLTALHPFDLEQGTSLFSYYRTGYLGTLTFLVPEEYRSLGEAVGQQLKNNTRFTVDMQVLPGAQVQERMQQGDYSVAILSMDETGDASEFVQPDSIFHYESAEAQAAYAEALAATNDDDYQSKLRDYARILSEDAASDWLYVSKIHIVTKAKLEGFPTNLATELMPLHDLMMH